ncbi:uncharacterized protein PAC_08467 [Phialocephala subalpina]|uniref:CBM-cenC domain-containing protein n=1 Tax=Phialocephala subalpina TaxID=576137 RepID=A0A1L7X0M6_9HELO|nr:uncharacterized protein PAC_08467 [Phialocephala subalpina]
MLVCYDTWLVRIVQRHIISPFGALALTNYSNFLRTVVNVQTEQHSVVQVQTVVNAQTEQQAVANVHTQQSTAVVVATAYRTAPTCSATPTIVNPSFEDSLNGWEDHPLGSHPGYTIGVSSGLYPLGYQYDALASGELDFPSNSGPSNILALYQVVTVCPGVTYDFFAYATGDDSNGGQFYAQICVTPAAGTFLCSKKQHLFTGDDRDDGRGAVQISFPNADLTPLAVTLELTTWCLGIHANTVYFDAVTVSS